MSTSDLSSDANWSKSAANYSGNVGRTSTLSAARLCELADKLRPLSSSSVDTQVLDVGAGTGAVTLTIASQAPSTSVLATDLAGPMLENISSKNLSNVKTQVVDARQLVQELGTSRFTHVFCTFMLQTITTPAEAVKEMYTVLKDGGVVAIALWAQRNGPFEVWERGVQSIDPSYRLPSPFDDPHAWRTCTELERELKKIGLDQVSTEEVTMPFAFDGTEKFMEFWFGAKNPAAVKCMSNWPQERIEEAKVAVRKVCKEQYSDGKDLKTWAVLGVGRK
ncbi:MAG: hypothetical protein Q9165_006792 [Trypethelium subeluteriae]